MRKDDGRTHWEATENCAGCEEEHLECALAKLRRAERERDGYMQRLEDMAANTVNAMDWLMQKDRADAAEARCRRLAEALERSARCRHRQCDGDHGPACDCVGDVVRAALAAEPTP